jgi:hypothetical protein
MLMWKAIVAGTAALAIAGTSLVYAQPRSDRDGGQRWRPTTEDLRAFGEARLAALKAGLTLTPEQEKNWPAFENALRDIGKMRTEQRAAMQERRESRSDDPVARMRRQAEAMTNAGATLKRLADAQEPLYQSLDDSQKNRGHQMMRGPRDGRGERGDRGERNMPEQGSNGSGQL